MKSSLISKRVLWYLSVVLSAEFRFTTIKLVSVDVHTEFSQEDSHKSTPLVSAASSLEILPGSTDLFMVDDVRPHLYTISMDSSPTVKARALLDERKIPRHDVKRYKPDFESLASIDTDTLLALQSGSTPRRECGVFFSLPDKVVPANFSALFQRFRALSSMEKEDFNIEGLTVLENGRMLFGNRGNGPSKRDVIWAVDGFSQKHVLAPPQGISNLDSSKLSIVAHEVFLPQLTRATENAPWTPVRVRSGSYDSESKRCSPSRNCVQLTLTDMCDLGETGLLLSVAAELTESTYEDGDVVSSGFVLLDPKTFQTTHLWLIDTESSSILPPKIEGVVAVQTFPQVPEFSRCSRSDASVRTTRFLAVNDPDDPEMSFSLFCGELPM